MIRLILDSSHKYLAIGLVHDDKIIYKKQAILKQKQSEFLITFIQEALEQTKLNKTDIAEIILTDGPGSYTGMRIAMTFVKVFALTQTVDVYTVNTLLSLSGSKEGFAFIDARSKRVFGGFVNKGLISEEKVYTLDEIKGLDVTFLGDVELLDKKTQEIDVISNIFEVKDQWNKVENVDLLSPRYA